MLREHASLEIDKTDYKTTIKRSFKLLRHLDKFYKEASVDIKQKLVALIFTEKMIFENGLLQTLKLNEIVSVIMMESKKLETIKKGTKKNFLFSPLRWVCRDYSYPQPGAPALAIP